MIISPGPARPLVPLASGCCCCPVLLHRLAVCCLLMLACLTGTAKAHPLSSQGLPASRSSATAAARSSPYLPTVSDQGVSGKCRYNLTEVAGGGRHLVQYQELEHRQAHAHHQGEGESRVLEGRGCEQGEYLLPAPGPHLLILVNFTRIQSQFAVQVNSNSGHSTNSSSKNSTTTTTTTATTTTNTNTIHDKDSPLSSNTSSEESGEAEAHGERPPSSSRSGSGEPSSRSESDDNRVGDMLAVDDARRQRLHHSEGDQLRQQPSLHHHRLVDTVPTAPATATVVDSQKGRLGAKVLAPSAPTSTSVSGNAKAAGAVNVPSEGATREENTSLLTTDKARKDRQTEQKSNQNALDDRLSSTYDSTSHISPLAGSDSVQRQADDKRYLPAQSSKLELLSQLDQYFYSSFPNTKTRLRENSGSEGLTVKAADDIVLPQVSRSISPADHVTLVPDIGTATTTSGSVGHRLSSSRDHSSVPSFSSSGQGPPAHSQDHRHIAWPSERRSDTDTNAGDSRDNTTPDSKNTQRRHPSQFLPHVQPKSPPSTPARGEGHGLDNLRGATLLSSSTTTTTTTQSFNAKNSVRTVDVSVYTTIPSSSSPLSSQEDAVVDSDDRSKLDSSTRAPHSPQNTGTPGSASLDCTLKLIIEETNPQLDREREEGQQTSSSIASESEKQKQPQPQVLCFQPGLEGKGRAPLAYRYSAPIKITYLWANNNPSGFSLQFSFLSLEEVECHFQCSTTPHLCLISQQLCDGYSDCPDHSDEQPHLCDSALQQGSTGKGTKVSNVIVAGVVLPCSFVVVIVVLVVLMIKHKQFGHAACRSGDSLLSPPPSHSSEVCRSSQDSGQNEALLPDRPPSYSQLLPNQQEQQHQQVLTYTSSGVVSSLQPVQQLSSAQQIQYTLAQQQHKQQHPQYQQLQNCNNNGSGSNINNNDLSGAVSFQNYQLPQQSSHHQRQLQQPTRLEQPSPSQNESCHPEKLRVHQQQQLPIPSSSPLAFTASGLNSASPHGVVSGYQHHIYNNPLSSDDDTISQHHPNQQLFSHQHPQPQQQQQLQLKQHQKNQAQRRRAKQSQFPTSPPTSSVSPTMSVLPPPAAQQPISVTCPPHIPVSLDGEEGYLAAQRALHSKRQMEQNLEAEYGLFRAPPNRSALERDSPPPPYSLQPPSSTGLSLDSLLSGSYFSSSCPTSFSSSSNSQSPSSGRGGNTGRGGRGHSHSNSSPRNFASSAPNSRH